MQNIWIEGKKDSPVFVLLHGTGGNEQDLVPLAQKLDEDASILSFLGDVNENGMARFFKRIRPGVFDEDDVKVRALVMRERLDRLAKERNFDASDIIAIGYSNGANLLAAMLYLNEAPFKRAVLLHPMVPLSDIRPKRLNGKAVLVTAGKNDPICPVDESETLVESLKQAGAGVTLSWFREGHAIGRAEVDAVQEWTQNIKKG